MPLFLRVAWKPSFLGQGVLRRKTGQEKVLMFLLLGIAALAPAGAALRRREARPLPGALPSSGFSLHCASHLGHLSKRHRNSLPPAASFCTIPVESWEGDPKEISPKEREAWK